MPADARRGNAATSGPVETNWFLAEGAAYVSQTTYQAQAVRRCRLPWVHTHRQMLAVTNDTRGRRTDLCSTSLGARQA